MKHQLRHRRSDRLVVTRTGAASRIGGGFAERRQFCRRRRRPPGRSGAVHVVELEVAVDRLGCSSGALSASHSPTAIEVGDLSDFRRRLERPPSCPVQRSCRAVYPRAARSRRARPPRGRPRGSPPACRLSPVLTPRAAGLANAPARFSEVRPLGALHEGRVMPPGNPWSSQAQSVRGRERRCHRASTAAITPSTSWAVSARSPAAAEPPVRGRP